MSLRQLPELKAFDALAGLDFKPEDDDFDAQVVAADAGDGTAISLYGVIGVDPVTGTDNSERRISAALRSIGRRDVTVNLNSPGGSFYSGLAIYNLLRAHEAKVTINVLGMAGSAASVIAMAGDEVAIGDGAHIMVHKASAIAMGNEYDLSAVVDVLKEVDAEMARLYAARTGVEQSVAASWMDKKKGGGSRFYADEAISLGMADRKLPKSAVKAEDTKGIPEERVIERALVRGEKLPAATAKALLAKMKGARDAAPPAARDAGFDPDAVRRVLATLNI